MNGTVTVNALNATAGLPWFASASWGASNSYQLGTGTGVLNFAAAPFVVVIAGVTASLAAAQMLFSTANAGNTAGTDIQFDTGGHALATNRGASTLTTANTVSVGVPWVVSFGTSGSTLFVKLNMGAVVSGASAFTANAANGAFIGNSAGGGNANATSFFEFYAAAQTPTAALLTNINRLVLRGLGLDQPDYNLA